MHATCPVCHSLFPVDDDDEDADFDRLRCPFCLNAFDLDDPSGGGGESETVGIEDLVDVTTDDVDEEDDDD